MNTKLDSCCNLSSILMVILHVPMIIITFRQSGTLNWLPNNIVYFASVVNARELE